MDILIPLLVAGVFYVPLLFLATSWLTPQQQRSIRTTLLIAFGLRVAVSLVFALVPETRVFHDDASNTEWLSVRLADSWLGLAPPLPPMQEGAKNYGLIYLFAGIVSVTGRYPLSITVFNSFIGAMNALLIYRIGLRLLDERVARRAARYVAFYPSMIIWSSIALKDPFMTFCICVTLLSAIHLIEKLSVLALIGCLAPLIVVYPIRFYLVYFLAAALIGTIALGREGKLVAGLSKQLVLVTLLVVVAVALGFAGNATTDAQYFDLATVSQYRHGMAATANSGFAGDVDISSPGRALLFLPLGLSVLIWGPFPWQMTSAHTLLTAPEMLFWWYLAPSLYRGVKFAAFERFRLFAPILVFAAIMLIGYSLTLGNMGAAYRMRAQVIGFLFLLASLGEYLKVASTNGIDPRYLLNQAVLGSDVPQERMPVATLAPA